MTTITTPQRILRDLLERLNPYAGMRERLAPQPEAIPGLLVTEHPIALFEAEVLREAVDEMLQAYE